MTNTEAYYDITHYIVNGCCNGANSLSIETLTLAQCAISKQIPMKPQQVGEWKLCPMCYKKYGFSYDILVGMTGEKTGECHCLNCGQLINLKNN